MMSWRAKRRSGRAAWLCGVAAVFAVCGGCAARDSKGPPPPPVALLAVLPIEHAIAAAAVPVPGSEEERDELPADAGMVVTAQIYSVLADQSEFQFVPDLTVAGLMHTVEVKRAANRIERARALGKESAADGVIFGAVSRFRERVGTQYGATEPASVSFELGLLDLHTGEVVWQGRFDETQQPLSSNLFKLWMFWRGGPRWFNASELARLGVERLLDDMEDAVER